MYVFHLLLLFQQIGRKVNKLSSYLCLKANFQYSCFMCFSCQYLKQTFLRQKISLTLSGLTSMISNTTYRNKDVLNLKYGGFGSCKHTQGCNNGVLLYVLHLRFLCPSPRKRSRAVHKCKSNPQSAQVRNITDIEDERRFYLYDDMRVVFPQRHSDADEGKVSV